MPLTFRTNGSGSPNIITASWFNDYFNLFTGVMLDQNVTITNNLTLTQISSTTPGAITLALVAGTALGVGVYQYLATFVTAGGGESLSGTVANITTTTNNQAVNLSAIPTGPAGTTARNIYRTVVGGSVFKLLTTLADNTTTTFSDTTADGSLGTQNPPVDNTFGGTLTIKNAAGTINAFIKNDGAALLAWLSTLDPSPQTLAGGSSGTAKLWQPLRGEIKLVVMQNNNFKTGASAQAFTLVSPFVSGFVFLSTDIATYQYMISGTGQTATVFTSLGTGGGGNGTTTNISTWSIGHLNAAINQISHNASAGSAHTGWLLAVGN